MKFFNMKALSRRQLAVHDLFVYANGPTAFTTMSLPASRPDGGLAVWHATETGALACVWLTDDDQGEEPIWRSSHLPLPLYVRLSESGRCVSCFPSLSSISFRFV